MRIAHNAEIRYLDPSFLEEAVMVLTRAFEDYPFFTYVLKERQDDYLEKLSDIHRFVLDRYMYLGNPCIGVFLDSKLAGVIAMAFPRETSQPADDMQRSDDFFAGMGDIIAGRLKRISKLSEQYYPATVHCYVGMLGMDPDYQGRGLTRLLLDEVHTISEKHEKSEGVFLETTRLKNVGIYQHFGYKLLAEDRFEDVLDRWYLYRPNS